MKVTVYGKPNCVQCTATERTMNAKGITFDKVNLEENPEAAARLIASDHRTLPVVEVDGVLSWGGFQPDKSNQLAP